MEASGIILAGGRSSRMGGDKTLMSYQQETLIERTVKEMKKVADEIIISSNHTAKYGIPGTVEVADIYPGMGPLGGIHAGLLASSKPHAFVVACDMPLFKAELAFYLLERCMAYDVVVPTTRGRWEPLCAVYSRKCIKPIEEHLQAGIRTAYEFYDQVRVLKVSEAQLDKIGQPEEMFYNLNTPEDYKTLCEGKAGKTQQKVILL